MNFYIMMNLFSERSLLGMLKKLIPHFMLILFLNHDYTEEDEKGELKVFLFTFFIFFSVIMVQKIE